jgi:hypothetical protein
MDPLELETELTEPAALMADRPDDAYAHGAGVVDDTPVAPIERSTSATAPAPARGRGLTLRRALVVSGSPDQLNANAGLRPYVVDGLREALPEAMALGVPYELGVAAVTQWQPQLVIVFGSVIMDTSDFAALAQACRRQAAGWCSGCTTIRTSST